MMVAGMEADTRSKMEAPLLSSLTDLSLQDHTNPQPDQHHDPPTSTSTSTPTSTAPSSSCTKDPSTHPLPAPVLAVTAVTLPCGLSDHAYLYAAAIFQRHLMEKPVEQRLIRYGKKMDTPLPEARDTSSQRQAYELAFNTLKYQDLLEDIMIDSGFHTSQEMSEDSLPLVMVMLYDLQDRKFLPPERSAVAGEEPMQEVRRIESCLNRCKTRLAASLARCRVKQGLLSISCVLSESVRTKQHRGRNLPVYAWVNTLRSSVEEVCEALRGQGVCEAGGVSHLGGCVFCRDPLCPDTLVFPPHLTTLLHNSPLTREHTLIIQDRSVCLAVCSLRPLLSAESDVMVVGSFSALTVAHIAVLAAACSGRVLVCGADRPPAQREEIQGVLTNMDIKNVRVMSEEFKGLDEWDPRVQRLKVILVLPQCSVSAANNPVETIVTEHGDPELLQDLSQGSVSQGRLHSLVDRQARDLTHALTFPKVQAVVYCTRSVYPEENELLVKRVLKKAETHPKLLPFRVRGPVLSGGSRSDGGGIGTRDKFFRAEPSELTNGCFITLLAREADPSKVETVQDVLARAAAKGLLSGIVTNQSDARKKDRHRKTRPPARTNQSPSTFSQEQPGLPDTALVIGQKPGNSVNLSVKPLTLGEGGEGGEEEGSEEGEGEGDTEAGQGKRKGVRKGKTKPKQRPKRSPKPHSKSTSPSKRPPKRGARPPHHKRPRRGPPRSLADPSRSGSGEARATK